jgi:ribA/ribD-fused uncharacterized protein
VITFWSGSDEYFEFSNFYDHPLGRYANLESAYQAQKFPKNEHLFLWRSGAEAKKVAKENKLVIRDDWDDVRVDVMYTLLKKKFEDPQLAALLRSTGDTELVHWAPWDQYWGWSKEKGGENVLGQLLMRVRKEL